MRDSEPLGTLADPKLPFAWREIGQACCFGHDAPGLFFVAAFLGGRRSETGDFLVLGHDDAIALPTDRAPIALGATVSRLFGPMKRLRAVATHGTTFSMEICGEVLEPRSCDSSFDAVVRC